MGRRDGRPGLLAVADRGSRRADAPAETPLDGAPVLARDGGTSGPPIAARDDGRDLLDGLERLAALHASGDLDADEFAAAKRRLLA